MNTMWFGGGAVINTPRNLRIMAEAMYAAGVKPEIEVFDSNAALVEKAVRIIEDLGGRLATVAEARSLLGLKAAYGSHGSHS